MEILPMKVGSLLCFSISKCTYFAVFFQLFAGICFSQTTQPDSTHQSDTIPAQYYLGILGGYAKLWHNTTLEVVPGSQTCGVFENGKSNGWFAGISGEYVLIQKYLEVSARVIYSSRPVILEYESSNNLEVYDPASKLYLPYLRHQTYSGTMSYMFFDFGFRSAPIDFLPIYIRLSADAGSPIFGATFSQTEAIVSPNSVLFPDGTKKHTVYSGDIQNTATAYGAIATIGADIPFQPQLTLIPEISYRYALNSILKFSDWKTNSLQFSMGLRWEFRKNSPQIIPIDTTPIPPPPPVIAQKQEPVPVFIHSINTTPLEIQQTIVTQTFPLLPYIFFDSASIILRSRYIPSITASNKFEESSLPKDAISTNYHLLPILAYRLQSRAAKIIITGTTDGKELPTLTQRKKLAEERAVVVSNYLKNQWNIPNDLISIQTRDIPEIASSDRYAEGNEENRRAEIASQEANLLGPVVHSKFLEFAPLHDKQNFSITVNHPELVKSWELSITHFGKNYKVSDGEKIIPAILEVKLTQELTDKLGVNIAPSDSLEGTLTIIQEDYTKVSAKCMFPIIKTENKFEVSRLSLIVFDFDRADITVQNQTMMKSFVQEAIKPTSLASIIGSTDRLGEKQHNQELSQFRAEAVRNYLLSLKPDATIISVKGIGASVLPYDNNLPEGRYYCRTVQLEVKTPIEKR